MLWFSRFLPRHETSRGIACALAALFLFSVMAAIAKDLAGRYSVFEIAFFRFLFALPPLLPFLLREGGVRALKTKRPLAHLWRSLVGLSCLVLYFYSIKLLPLADAVTITFTNPLFIALLSILLLREKVGLHRWSAIVCGFIGVIIMAEPTGQNLNHGVFYGLAGAFFYALAMISLRTLTRTESVLTTTALFTLISCALTAIPTALDWKTPENAADMALLVTGGLVSGVGQYLLTQAYQLASPSVISPFNYTSILWATLFGFVLWGQVPAPHVLVGAGIIIASGLYILHRERVRRKKPLPACPAP